MKKLFSIVALFATLAAFAVDPAVSNVKLSFNEKNRLVCVDYDLNMPAIVTVRFYNGIQAIDKAVAKSLVGDVNRMIDRTTGCRLYWNVGADLPDSAFDANALKVEFKLYTLQSSPKFMVIDLRAHNTVRYYDSLEEVPGGIGPGSSDLNRTECIVLRKIPAKGVQFAMGSPSDEAGRDAASENRVLVTIPYDYYFSVYTLTQAQHKMFNPTGFQGGFTDKPDSPLKPLTSVTYNYARGSTDDGIDWPTTGYAVSADSILGRLRAYSGVDVDIPTEAEWEFAARGGYGTALPDGKNMSGPYNTGGANECRLGWFKTNVQATYGSVLQPGPVGYYPANRFDIQDVCGNPYELARDWYVADRATLSGVVLHQGPTSGTTRSFRAGTYSYNAQHGRLAKRGGLPPNSGDNFAVRLVVPCEAE